MTDMDALARAYARFVALPWAGDLAYPQRVWTVVYPPRDERRLRARLAEFEIATTKSGHGWRQVDVTDAFAGWLGRHPYRDAYFEEPELLSGAALEDFDRYVQEAVVAALEDPAADENTAVALVGVGSLFPFSKVSRVLDGVGGSVRGRLVVFFPGERDGSNYRLLEARDGWNYLATPITDAKDAL
ncbi:BREX protein BrxB domain-containing protein [Actinacidiphila sp. ITFR-21]|uniref:BREX protein BrxB domain-containing protein n=1 Tax=Actinacidiphila sp. ITFR-21 TaxID=3075199 RepID=UPI00288B0B6B|nr:BREX protein BrxB domain-containing protein [Streptomyces sp. ITFR-21]WNI14279.1 DUF1788 domain-containing protein [Streptomyces sp. ITFR-21]